MKSLFKAKRIQETGSRLRTGRQAPVSQFSTSPPFPSPSTVLPPARRPLGARAKPAAFQEGRHRVPAAQSKCTLLLLEIPHTLSIWQEPGMHFI